MTTASLTWRDGQDTTTGSVAATVARDETAWTSAGATFTTVDDGLGGQARFAGGAVELDGQSTDFGVLAYQDDDVSHLIVGGPYDDRIALTVKVLRELLAASILPSPDVVLEVIGLPRPPSDLALDPPQEPAPARRRRSASRGAVKRYEPRMNKTELIEAIAKDSGLTRADSSRALDSMLTTVAKTLKKGDDVAITGFGKFSVVKRGARTGRNPQTGEPVKIKASKNPKFTAGATLKNAVAARRK